ncbi:MAG: hypothetical protein AB7G05_05180 [Hyphomonadaceae bacterium]
MNHTISGISGVHPTFVLIDPTPQQIVAFENYLANGVAGRISTIETLGEISSRTYTVRFVDAGADADFAAQLAGGFLYNPSTGRWTIHPVTTGGWGEFSVNWDAVTDQDGVVNAALFSEYFSHEVGQKR